MGRFIEFIGNHWILSTLWIVLLAALLLYHRNKSGKSLSPQEATLLVNRQNAVLLDVRDKKEFDKGHIAGALNIPLKALPERSGELGKHRESPVIVVDQMGQHAGEAVKMLSRDGFANVGRMAGGMTEWRSQGLPVVGGKSK